MSRYLLIIQNADLSKPDKTPVLSRLEETETYVRLDGIITNYILCVIATETVVQFTTEFLATKLINHSSFTVIKL